MGKIVKYSFRMITNFPITILGEKLELLEAK